MNKKFSLQAELDRLEVTDPAVAEAARRYEDTVNRLISGHRLDRFRLHRAGDCNPVTCEYVHSKEERGLAP